MLLQHYLLVFEDCVNHRVHNLGHVVFYTQLFDELGVDPGDELMNFLQRKEKNKERKKIISEGLM
jgi:hypothetical protein